MPRHFLDRVIAQRRPARQGGQPGPQRLLQGRHFQRERGAFAALGGDTSLTFRAESLNLLNHPQFAEPGRNLTSPDFGQITNTLNDGRAFKFTLQLDF